MEELKDYKQEITQTRVGCLGSSDGRMLEQIATLGKVPKSAYKRLAVCKGLIPQEEIPTSAAMKAGDDLEMMVYEHLTRKDPRYESNPLWVSDKYSRKNVKLISHPDIVLKDDARRMMFVYEVKTTKFGFDETKENYKTQLYIHYILSKEMAAKYGDGWGVKVFLVHYSTEGLDLENGIEFDPMRLTVKSVTFNAPVFNANRAMDIVDEFLEGFDEYYEGDEVDSAYLPQNIKKEFDSITNILSEIKEREVRVEEFKNKLCSFMQKKGIRNIKSDTWAITLVQATENISVDYKAIFENEIETKTPRKAKALKKKYQKTTKKRAYVQIRVNNDNKS